MAVRKKKRRLRPRTPSRIKRRTKTSGSAGGRRAVHVTPELTGLGVTALGLFLASLSYLGWEGGLVGEEVERGLHDFVGAAAYVAPAALVCVGGLMLFRSSLL